MYFEKKLTSFEITTLISILGMVCWYLTDYYGGMIIHAIQYWFLIIPILILYIIVFLRFIYKLFKTGIKSNMVLTLFHLLFFSFLLLIQIFESDLLKSKRILTGTLKDDLSSNFNF